MRRVCALLAGLLLSVTVVAAVQTTDRVRINLLRGSSTVATLSSWDACRDEALRRAAADTRTSGTVTYTCQTERRDVIASYSPNPPPTPAPVDCVVSVWGEWTPITEWTACVDGVQSRQERRSRYVIVAPSGGGAACPALTEDREISQQCETEPPPPPPPPPPSGAIFAADYSSIAGNWDTQTGVNRSPANFVQRIVQDGGRNVVELVQTPGGGAEYYWGHAKNLPNFTGSRFYRFRIYHDPANNYRAGDGGRVINKLLILGQSGGGCARMILNANGYVNSNPAFEIIFDGWPSAPPEVSFSKGVWHDVQLESRWGSGGFIKVWVDSNNYASPTIGLNGNFSCAANGYTHFGAYYNDSLASNGRHMWRHADFQVGASFDPTWH